MNIVVPVKLVPDLVEELTIGASGTALDTAWLRRILSEFDDHAIEQAILLKERGGGTITVITLDVEGADDTLFGAAAKGADRLIKLVGDVAGGVGNHALARALVDVVKSTAPDLVLTGVQAHDDLDGALGPLLAEYLGMPYVGYVSSVAVGDGHAVAHKEYPGGLIAEMEVSLPAVLGIQAADQPPRYVPVGKIRQAMKTATIEEQAVPPQDVGGAPIVSLMRTPEATARAMMLEGKPEDVAVRLMDIFRDLGVL
jgi:electron transfer flavoprotein beta subunit